MRGYEAIQTDEDGLYHDIQNVTMFRKKMKSPSDLGKERKELLDAAIDGDAEAVELLRKRYKLKRFIHGGKEII